MKIFIWICTNFPNVLFAGCASLPVGGNNRNKMYWTRNIKFVLPVQLATPAGVEENMEIDAECSSSQARMECLSPGKSSSWVIPYSSAVDPDPQCCRSGMLIPDLIFIHPGSRIQQLHQKRREKNFFCPTIFCSHQYHKIVNNFIFEQVKKILARTLRIIVLFTQKICHLTIKNTGKGSEIRDPEKPFPDSAIQRQKGPGSATLVKSNLTSCFRLREDARGHRFLLLLLRECRGSEQPLLPGGGGQSWGRGRRPRGGGRGRGSRTGRAAGGGLAAFRLCNGCWWAHFWVIIFKFSILSYRF